MLSIKPIGSSSQEVSYYASLGVDYYVSGEEPPGEWWGSGAKALGLDGAVDPIAFRNLLEGFHADGQEKLVQNAGRGDRRAAFDLTWSLVKSSSALWSQCDETDRNKLENAATKSLFRTLAVFDDLCGVTRRGSQGERVEKAGLIAAVFKHETSRGVPGVAPDPNIHFHVVVANAVVREDGTTGAFDARPLFQRNMKMALGAMFRAEFCKELMSLGLETYRPLRANGQKASWFELRAIPPRLIDAFSKRRRAIEKWLSVNGQSGAKAAELAAKKTRRKKERFTHSQLFSSWLETARGLGINRSNLPKLFRSHRNIDEPTAADAAVQEALQRIMKSQSHFDPLP